MLLAAAAGNESERVLQFAPAMAVAVRSAGGESSTVTLPFVAPGSL